MGDTRLTDLDPDERVPFEPKEQVLASGTAPYAAALLYYQWGAKFWADTTTSAPRRKAKGIWGKLKSKYPASSFWGSAKKAMGE